MEGLKILLRNAVNHLTYLLKEFVLSTFEGQHGALSFFLWQIFENNKTIDFEKNVLLTRSVLKPIPCIKVRENCFRFFSLWIMEHENGWAVKRVEPLIIFKWCIINIMHQIIEFALGQKHIATIKKRN